MPEAGDQKQPWARTDGWRAWLRTHRGAHGSEQLRIKARRGGDGRREHRVPVLLVAVRALLLCTTRLPPDNSRPLWLVRTPMMAPIPKREARVTARWTALVWAGSMA